MTWSVIVQNNQAKDRLDGFWSSLLRDEGVSRARIQKWIRRGRALVDGRPCCKPNTRLEAGQHVRLTPIEDGAPAAPCAGELDIVYKDEHILVINKPAGLTVHPAPSVAGPTLVNILVHHFPEIEHMDPERPGIVHRLDKDTSGLMMVALDEPTRLKLAKAFADREMDKEYLAVVHGVPEPDKGEIDFSIGRHPSIKTRMAIVDKGGRPARSSYRVVWPSPDGCYSLVRVRIHTGRTHQVRVHMTGIGHPLVGDRTYRSNTGALSSNGPRVERAAARQMLHAWRLGFVHPTTGRECAFTNPPPGDVMRTLLMANRRVQHVGLTGMSGSGKSTVLAAFARQGVPVWSADECVAGLYGAGGDGRDFLAGRFGDRFVPGESEPVDKKKLFAAMIEEPSLRREIEGMIHPMVIWDLKRFLEEHAHARFTVSEVPLLMESGRQTRALFDCVLGVFCPNAVRRTLLSSRGWSSATMAVMDSWQWSQRDKLAGCDLVIPNDRDEATLGARVGQAGRVLRSLRRGRMHQFWEWLHGFVTTRG
ncbi:dephospho-CoA kinase [Desulfoplanes sp.]